MSTRPLTDRERTLLAVILSVDFPGGQDLRAQLPKVAVERVWTEGSPSVDLCVSGDAVRARGVPSPVPVDALVMDDAGEPVGELLVWLEDGLLAGLEYAWFTDEMPSVLPGPDHLRLARRASPTG